MRIWIRGPGIGPVRTTLWSSGGRKNGTGGKVLAVLSLPFLAVALAAQFRFWPFDVFIASVAALVLFGLISQRRERGQDAETARLRAARLAAEADRDSPESPAAHSDRR
jgi:hypothetical protein